MTNIKIFCIAILFVLLNLDAYSTLNDSVIKKDEKLEVQKEKFISQPLATHIFTADPSAHVFNGKLYIYPSHDVANGINDDAPGGGFGMVDYHVFSLDEVGSKVTDHGEVLHVKDVPWANKMMWAPDAASKNERYYLYFPAKGDWGIFQIGVAVSNSPSGPFTAQPEPIKGSYSIDPCVFKDDNDDHYMYFGGIDGGQLQYFKGNNFGLHYTAPLLEEPALSPRVAKLSNNMLEFAEDPKEIQIVDDNGNPLKGSDNSKRFFEASWMHKYRGKYYFSYSTGDTHQICYAIGDNPYGPFTYQGVILKPVVGWTTHHSICKYKDKWYLFYHDSMLSGGNTVMRSIKMTDLHYDTNGKIKTIYPCDEN
jgi:hypothetical protein